MVFRTGSNLKRSEMIDLVIKDLYEFRIESNDKLHYAIDENIVFFEAVKSLPKYLYWLIMHYPNIDQSRICELADFSLHGGLWEKILVSALTEAEQRPATDLLKPLRLELIRQISKISNERKKPVVLVNFGCGAMEIERQLANYIKQNPLPTSVVMVGIDSSLASRDAAQENLKQHNPYFRVVEDIAAIDNLGSENIQDPINIYFLLTDVDTAMFGLSSNSIDIAFYSRLKHHLPKKEKKNINRLLQKISSRVVIESDDYRGLYLPILSIITSWKNPVFMNGAVFTSLRVPTKKQLKEAQSLKWRVSITPAKGYVKVYENKGSA